MTIPSQMNCEHSGEGWCLGCVMVLEAKNERLRMKALPESCNDCRYCVRPDDHIPGCDTPIGAEEALKDNARLEAIVQDAEDTMAVFAMEARHYPKSLPLNTPVIAHGHAVLTVGVFFDAEEWWLGRLDEALHKEWLKRAKEIRAEATKKDKP